jgi:serine/threonine protein phosphatase PrpC
MEDAHITNPAFEPDVGLFAIFDGHGGLECAKFCEKFFEPKLRE